MASSKWSPKAIGNGLRPKSVNVITQWRSFGSPSSPVQKTHQQHVREICSALEAHSEREPGPHKLILLFQRIGKSNRWTSYLMDLRGQNNNLPALKDEMAKAGL